MQRACSWRKRKTRVSREPYRRMHLLSHCRAPAPECSRRPPARPATAPLPQPPQPLPPPLAPGAEQEPRASASARPGRAGRAGSASSLGDGAAPRGSGPAMVQRGSRAGPARAPVGRSWVSSLLSGGERVREARRRAGRAVAELGLCHARGGGDAPSWGMGPLGPQSASDRWPAAGGSEVRFRREDPGGLWGSTATLLAGTRSGIVPLCKCRTRRHRNSAGQRSFRDLENGFRDEGHILLSS